MTDPDSGETDAWCPYCDRLRGHNNHGLMATCGSEACFRAACRAAAMLQRPSLSGGNEIDFGNGFASQNLTFTADRARLRT